MGLVDSLKETYYSVEDKWYSFVDSVSEKVPAIGSIVDVVEEKGIPSFPLAILIVLLLIIGVFFLFTSTSASTISLTILDDSQNPLNGANVAVMQNGEKVKEDLTDSQGKISFVLNNGTYSVRATKDKYTSATKSIVVNANANEELVLSIEDTKVTRAVYLKTSTGDLITGYGRVFYRCKDTTDSETKDTDYSNGKFNAELNESCAQVEVISLENYSLLNATASFSGDGAVTVEQIQTTTGNAAVTLSVASSTETIAAGLRVKLVAIDGTVPLETLTSGTNVVLFNDVVPKVYYVMVQDLTGNYQTYNGSTTADTKEIKKGETTQFTAVLTKTPASIIAINVKDILSGLPVKGAEVKLASTQNTEEFQTQLTGATGQLTFKVSQGNSFVVTVDHPEYLIGETTPAQAGDTLTISLTKADSSNSNSILVRVVDAKKNPIDNVRVTLKTLDVVQPVVGEKMTGTNGEAEFTNLTIGKTYMVVAAKDGFGSVNSESVQVSPRAQKILEVPFNIEEKTITIRVVTPENTPIYGANVKAMNYFTSEQIGTVQSTGTEGTTIFSIRADKKVYFIIEAPSYSKYFTSAEYISTMSEKQVVMQKPVSQLKASIVGIYSGDSEIKTSGDSKDSLSSGIYLVKAVVQVPKGTFSEAGLHFRVGKETQNITNLVEEDGLYIDGVESSGRIVMGTTYSPPNDYATDSKNLITSGKAKWINSTWKSPQEGTYEVDATVNVTETNPNAPLNIYYRGWAKGSSVLRYPTGTLSGNELYAPANVRMLSSGATNLCTGSFCKTVTVEALSGSEIGKKKYVTGTIEAKKDVEYLLTIDLVNYSGKAISSAAVSVEGTSLDVNSLTINGALQAETTASVGTIGIDSPLKVQVIFKSTNSGASAIKLSVNSSTQNELENTFNVNVKPNKTFTMEMIPKVIVPYLQNTLFFEVMDSNTPLNGVIISLKVGTTTLGNITTNGEGLAQYNLAAPRVGTTLTITAKKEGYNDVVLTKQIDKSVLTLVPPKIEETIKIGETASIQTQIIVQNNTAKTIKLVSATVNGDLKNYLDIKFNDTINGTIIEQGKDKNYNLSIKLNSLAARLTEPKDLTGTIVINTEVSGANQSFLNEIPVEIRLTFPGMLDSAKCLKITPATIDFVTTSSEVTKVITIANTCAAEGVKVNLRKLEAKLNEASKFGTISLIGSGLAAQLSDKYTTLGDILEKDSQTEVTITYSPTTLVESGTQNLVISILGKNLLDDGTSEKVEATTKVNVTMNNLAKCIVVSEPEGGILLDMAPWQQGYGRLMMSDYSSQLQSYQGFNKQSAPYGMNYQNGMGMGSYGQQGYGMQGYNPAYGGMGMQQQGMGSNLGANNASYSQSAFTITNNCTSDMEISLDVDPRITVPKNTLTIGAGSDTSVVVQPGYVLGKYAIKVSARVDGTKDAKKKIDDVSVIVRRLGDIDRDCIKTNVTRINLNSFVMKPQKYSAYNYCYDTGVQLSRANVAIINCSAPTGAGLQGLPYLQVGMEQQYGPGYALGSMNASYNSFSSNGGVCGNSQCSLITGTNIRQRSVDAGANGSIERVDFDVIPNPNYIPQRRLFNNKTGTAGLFQNVSDIRQWATETDARTDVYGNLNINYTNAYGAQECMEFPITITDIWRMGESIDSALNWGDPLARPIDCQRKGALDIISYWESRNTSAAKGTGGVVPETEYTGSNKNIYVYIADPGALRIGPMPNAQSQYYPQAVNTQYDYSYFQQQAALSKASDAKATPSDDARANCGLTDSIKVITKIPSASTGGATITLDTTTSGSLFKNSYGSNLMVQVDRSTMTANCVKLEMPIKASVTRAITMETQELTWSLRILFTKPGYTYKGIEGECMSVTQIDALPTDCIDKLRNALASAGITTPADTKLSNKFITDFLEANPLCTPYVSLASAIELLKAGSIKEECPSNPNEYGFDKILKTTLTSYSKSEIVDCTKYFCNDTMLQAFLLNRFAEIKEKVRALPSLNNATSLVELYKASGTASVKNCTLANVNYFKSATNSALVTRAYKIPSDLLLKDKVDSISNLLTNLAAIPDMIAVLDSINPKDKNSILLEFDNNKSFEAQYTALGMTSVGKKSYMTLNGYIELLKVLRDEEAKDASDCKIDNKACTVTYCGSSAKLDPVAFFNIIARGKLVQGIIDKPYKDMNKVDVELVYTHNPKLVEVHKLAKFDSELASSGISSSILLTAIASLGESKNTTVWLNKATGLEGMNTEFVNATSTQVGLYSVELDYDLKDATKTVKVILGEKKVVTDAPKAVDNVLLKAGFNFPAADAQNSLNSTTTATIVEMTQGAISGVFYKRIPVKLTVTLYGTETGLTYVPTETGKARPAQLIKWYNSNNVEMGIDKYVGGYYTIPVKTTGQVQIIKGIYYYPESGDLGVSSGITGGIIIAKAGGALVGFDQSYPIPGKNQPGVGIQASPVSTAANQMTLDTVIKLVNDKQACIKDNSITWNEKNLISAN